MWIILLSIYVFAKDVAGQIDCDKQFFDQCERPTLFEEIPREVGVFKALCPKISPYIECSRDYDMKCEEEDRRRFSKPEKYDDMVVVFDEICEEGTVLNEVMTGNLKCLNETFSNTNCPEKIHAFIDSPEKKVPSEEITTTHLTDENVFCMPSCRWTEQKQQDMIVSKAVSVFIGADIHTRKKKGGMILLANCIVEDITGHCGITARFATVEILRRTDFIGSACHLSYRKSLLQIIDEFDLTEEQKTFATAELERMAISDAI